MKKEEYWTGAHTKHRLKVHIVFIPKYRKRVLRGEIVQTIKTLFYEACEVNGWYLEKIAVEPDHVHLLLQYKPSKSISEILQIFKGWSSFKMGKWKKCRLLLVLLVDPKCRKTEKSTWWKSLMFLDSFFCKYSEISLYLISRHWIENPVTLPYNIFNTTNWLEWFFSHLNSKVRLHRGVKKERYNQIDCISPRRLKLIIPATHYFLWSLRRRIIWRRTIRSSH